MPSDGLSERLLEAIQSHEDRLYGLADEIDISDEDLEGLMVLAHVGREAAGLLAPFEQREVPVPSDGILTRFDFTQVTEDDDLAYWEVQMDEPRGRETETAWVARRDTSGGVIVTLRGPTPQDAIRAAETAAQEADRE